MRTIRSAALVASSLIVAASVATTAADESGPPPRQAAEACEPAAIPFDVEDIRLTGRWIASDGGIYYVRQVGESVWWLGMSDVAQAYGEVGRDFTNVGHGTLADGVVRAEFADVPRGNIWGNGDLSLQIEADPEGNLQARRLGGDFGAQIFRPCTPEVGLVSEFARPFTYQVPFGMGSLTWPGRPDQKVVVSADEIDAGLTFWIVGPGWGTVCSLPPGTPLPTDHSPEGILESLRAQPGLAVSDATEMTVDGRPALAVDITTATGAMGCNGDSYVRFWKQSGNEGGLSLGSTSRIVLLDVDGRTVAIEAWGGRTATWLPRAQEIDRLGPLPGGRGDRERSDRGTRRQRGAHRPRRRA